MSKWYEKEPEKVFNNGNYHIGIITDDEDNKKVKIYKTNKDNKVIKCMIIPKELIDTFIADSPPIEGGELNDDKQ